MEVDGCLAVAQYLHFDVAGAADETFEVKSAAAERGARLLGRLRQEGAYRQRAEHISVWNTTMDEHNYLTRHWSTFAASFAPG